MKQPQDSALSLERLGFATLGALLLAPIVAHGLWRPLAHVFGSAGSAGWITVGSLALCGVTAIARRLGRATWVPLVVAAASAVGLALALSLGAAGLGALLASAMTTAGVLIWLPARLPTALDGLARRRWRLTIPYVLMALLSVFSTARVSTFIGDPTQVDSQVLPGEKFTEVHSCLSAYVRAFELVREGAVNLYADHWWAGSLGLPPRPEGAENPFHPFELDNFSYPPSFFLVASVLAPLDGDFLAQRSLWYGLNGLLAALGIWIVASWISGRGAHRVMLLAPLFFGSLPALLTLQIGNFHLLATVLSVVAMVAFAQRASRTGGALLAITILSKISPGVLGIMLLAQRRLRDALLTAGFGAVLLALSLLIFGLEPLESFVTFALPRLSSGAAFPFMGTNAGITTNMAPFGIAFKLDFLGLDVGDPWHLGPQLARLYTVGIVALAVVGARRQGDRRDQAVRWMALLALAGLQSPFSPAYSTIGLLWATTVLAADVRRVRDGLALIALWPGILFVPPGLDTAQLAILSMAHTALTVGVAAWLVVRAPRFEGSVQETHRRMA